MNKQKRFEKILKNIKQVKIQGAKNIAEAALKAYELVPTKKSKKRLLESRPTEPMLQNVLSKIDKDSHKEIMNHFDNSQEAINKHTFKLIKNNNVVFTHCHSSTVIEALVYSKNKGKKFEVYHTETRPLFQGRKTSRELRKAGIKSTMFVDSAVGVALSKEQKTKDVDLVLIGADALLKKGIINKIGSEVIAILSKKEKIPFYILADSWKFSNKKIKLEQRSRKEIWASAKKTINFNINNPAFEFVPKKYITGIITEKGLMKYKYFVRSMKK